MKKLILSTAVMTAMIGSVAQASVTLDGTGRVVVTPANTYEVFLSGASALDNNIRNLVTNTAVPAAERVCDSAQPIFEFRDQGGGSLQRAFLCTLNPANPRLTGLAGGKTNIMVYKRNEGGSAMGVQPIIDDAKRAATASIEFMVVDPSLCAVPSAPNAAGLRTANCTYSRTTAGQFQRQIPDFGVSDVDPAQFSVAENTPSGFLPVSQSDIGLLTVESAGGLAFGIAANLRLRNALQEEQFPATSVCNPANAAYEAVAADDNDPNTPAGVTNAESLACMPSLTRDQVASLITGEMDNWNDFKVGTTGLFTAVTNAYSKALAGGVPTVRNRVHICTRTNGSGTKAQLGVKFLNFPCTSVATAPSGDNTATPESSAVAKIHALSSAGGVDECLSELNDASNTVGTAFNNSANLSRWAIGVLSLERNSDNARPWRFIKIDDVAPTLENIAEGKYLDWAELTFQFANNHVFDAGERAIVDELIRGASNPVVLNALNTTTGRFSFGLSGLLASPSNHAPDVNGLFVATRPVNPYSHSSGLGVSVNNCRIPAAWTGNVQVQ